MSNRAFGCFLAFWGTIPLPRPPPYLTGSGSHLPSFAADFIPIVRNVISTSLFVINVSLGTTITAVVVAIGWIRFRPMLAIGVVVGALALAYFLISGARKRGAAEKERSKTM